MTDCLERLERVERADDPRVALFRAMRDSELRPSGMMAVDSEKVVLRALKTGIRVRSILGSLEYFERHADLLNAHPDVRLFLASRSLLQDIVGHRIHQGMMALAERPADSPLEGLGPKIVALDHLVDAANVGAIARSCHAFGLTGLLVGDGCPSPFVRRSIRVSMGSVFKLAVRHSPLLTTDLTRLKKAGYAVLGAATWPEAEDLPKVRFPDRCVLVIGNEDDGLGDGVRALCDGAVRIPVVAGIDSLNAACAASVLLYEMGASP